MALVPARAGALIRSLKPENCFPFSTELQGQWASEVWAGWGVSGHLVGKKAWQDLACLFKNKVWVGGDYSTFCLSLVSSLFSAKSGKKLHLNCRQLASLQHSGNREAFRLVAPGLSPFPPWAQNWAESARPPSTQV